MDSDDLMPAPWYYRLVEVTINAVVVIGAAVPVLLATGNDYLAMGVGCGVLAVLNVAYWTLYREKSLTEVYPALKPWIGGDHNG